MFLGSGHTSVLPISCLSKTRYFPDDKVWRYLVYVNYWILYLRPLTVYPKVLLPQNFIIKEIF